MNRCEVTDKGIFNGRNPEGPVDHDVSVLRVEDAEGKFKGVVFGYVCHNRIRLMPCKSGDLVMNFSRLVWVEEVVTDYDLGLKKELTSKTLSGSRDMRLM